MASWHDLFREFWRAGIHGWGPEEYGAEHSLAMQSFRHGYEAAKHTIKQLENRLAAAQLAGDALESQLLELAEKERSSRADVEQLRAERDEARHVARELFGTGPSGCWVYRPGRYPWLVAVGEPESGVSDE